MRVTKWPNNIRTKLNERRGGKQRNARAEQTTYKQDIIKSPHFTRTGGVKNESLQQLKSGQTMRREWGECRTARNRTKSATRTGNIKEQVWKFKKRPTHPMESNENDPQGENGEPSRGRDSKSKQYPYHAKKKPRKAYRRKPLQGEGESKKEVVTSRFQMSHAHQS